MKLRQDKKRKSRDDVKARRRSSKYAKLDDSVAAHKSYSRHDNGDLPDEIDNDLTSDHLEQLSKGYYATKVVVTPEETKAIEVQTREQPVVY